MPSVCVAGEPRVAFAFRFGYPICMARHYILWFFTIAIGLARFFLPVRGLSTFSILGSYEVVAHFFLGGLIGAFILSLRFKDSDVWWYGADGPQFRRNVFCMFLLLTLIEIAVFGYGGGLSK
jgi:hypothetical protein